MTEDTNDPIARLRHLWEVATWSGNVKQTTNEQWDAALSQLEAEHAELSQLKAEHAEVILALEELVGLQATTAARVIAALGEAKMVLDRLGDNKAAARIKFAALREAANEMDSVTTGPGDLIGIALKSIVYRLKHRYAQEASDEAR